MASPLRPFRSIPARGEVLVQVKTVAVNPSDIKNVSAAMHEARVKEKAVLKP